MKKQYNAAAFPEAMRALPFCCWKYEKDQSGRDTKIPYNPITGGRAKVDTPSTFGTLEEALRAYDSGGYDGIGFHVTGIHADTASDTADTELPGTYPHDAFGSAESGLTAGVGCIDIDHCVTEEGLSDAAQAVLHILPTAYAEYSPSHTGVHLYFTLPQGFEFDRNAYYINNRNAGMEIYLPGATKHFMTVTGDVLNVLQLLDDEKRTSTTRDRNMIVTANQLQTFLDTFMVRTRLENTAITPPDGGSILTDAEVLQKLASGPNGARFMKLYRGEWEDCAVISNNAVEGDCVASDNNTTDGTSISASNGSWSHSEADMALCAKLAFFCRGDTEQMDRLFRQSGLMREKWDRRNGTSTYGEITMRNAILSRTAFYEPYVSPEAYSVFSPVSDSSISAVKVDFTVLDDPREGSHSHPEPGEQIDALLESEITLETILSENTLRLAAWAYKNDMLRYTRLRQAIPKQLSLRNFEKAMKRYLSAVPDSVISTDMNGSSQAVISAISTPTLLQLTGISAPGMLVPRGWIVDDRGICFVQPDGLTIPVSAEPLFISSKMENVDDGTEKMEITYRRNGRYKKLIAPRSELLNKNSIIRYADSGLPVSSGTAGQLTKFIAEMEAVNSNSIPLKRCIRRAGWVGDEFFPYYLHSPMVGQEDGENAERFLEHLHTAGSEQVWLDMAAKVRTMPFARAMLAASFASPLVYPLQHRNIYYHNWCDTRSGKTAALKFAMSVWGDPQALVKSYFATMVGMEHRAGTMKHLPLALDELQTIEKRLDINNMVYTLGNGVGKTRGRAGGGIRETDEWRNCILSTGEQPISTENSMDGINTRLLEIFGRPVDNEKTAAEMHQVSERNFGFASEKYIRWLVAAVLNDALNVGTVSSDDSGEIGNAAHTSDAGNRTRLKTDFQTMRSTLDMLYGDSGITADNIAVLALADYYASISVFGMEQEAAWNEAVEMGAVLMDGQKQEDHTDTVDRA